MLCCLCYHVNIFIPEQDCYFSDVQAHAHMDGTVVLSAVYKICSYPLNCGIIVSYLTL